MTTVAWLAFWFTETDLTPSIFSRAARTLEAHDPQVIFVTPTTYDLPAGLSAWVAGSDSLMALPQEEAMAARLVRAMTAMMIRKVLIVGLAGVAAPIGRK